MEVPLPSWNFDDLDPMPCIHLPSRLVVTSEIELLLKSSKPPTSHILLTSAPPGSVNPSRRPNAGRIGAQTPSHWDAPAIRGKRV